MREAPVIPLVCDDCCRVDRGGTGRGWKAFLGSEDDDSDCVVVLCPACAEREFDGA